MVKVRPFFSIVRSALLSLFMRSSSSFFESLVLLKNFIAKAFLFFTGQADALPKNKFMALILCPILSFKSFADIPREGLGSFNIIFLLASILFFHNETRF